MVTIDRAGFERIAEILSSLNPKGGDQAVGGAGWPRLK